MGPRGHHVVCLLGDLVAPRYDLPITVSYYNLDDTDHDVVNKYLSSLVERAVFDLEFSYCVDISEDNTGLEPTVLGRIASYYYLHHTTVRMFRDTLTTENTIPELLEILSNTREYAELPVRHNEDQVNSDLAMKLPLPVNVHTMDSSHTKTHLLLQAHFSDTPLPSSDYVTDLKSVLDQAIRILQALLDVSCDAGWLVTSLRIIQIVQMVVQGRWVHGNSLLCLPNVQTYHLDLFRAGQKGRGGAAPGPVESLPELMHVVGERREVLHAMLKGEMEQVHVDEVFRALSALPQLSVTMAVCGFWEGSSDGREKKRVNTAHQSGVRADWLEVHADQEYVLQVDLKRLNKTKKHDSKALAPRFPKPKDEGWFLLLGEVESREVIALKRLGFVRDRSQAQLSFFTPEEPGRRIYTLYVMSDSYLGLDQQYDVALEVVPASIEAQVNQEMVDLADLELDD